jgi:hypothetical protein
VSGTYTIYRAASEGTEAHADLKTITNSLNSLNADLHHSVALADSGQPLSTRDEQIGKLCRDYTKVADQLLSALDKLSIRKEYKLWDSFRVALTMIWNKAEFEQFQKRLEGFRQQISMHILVSLRWTSLASLGSHPC